MNEDPTVQRYVTQWSLTLDGALIETPSSWVQPVRYENAPAMLKLMKPSSDEENAPALLDYYGGVGAVRLLASDDHALLTERAPDKRSLVTMALSGEDMKAAAILADTTAMLHEPRDHPIPAILWPLDTWFESLFEHEHDNALLGRCAAKARHLLASPTDSTPLHGDLHHGNVLDGGARGWLAIDPKALIGERTYDVTNQICNPYPHSAIVHDAERMQRLANLYGSRLGIDPRRILDFTFAYAGLSASWDMGDDGDGGDPGFILTCAELLSTLVDP